MEVELPESLRTMVREKLYIYTGYVKTVNMLSKPLVVSIGAEAYILRGKFMEIDSIIKWRFPKPYMPPELDREFRSIRTEIEAKVMWRCLLMGIKTPIPLYVNTGDAVIIMTYIEGSTLRELANRIRDEELCRICREVGVYIAKMHVNGVSHGDLTTSNIIVDSKESQTHLIDFGLATFGKRDEDYAIDLHIFFRSIESAHIDRERIMKECFLNGYSSITGDYESSKMLKIVNDIRKRGRYVAERKLKSAWRSI
ncbi:MAG: Kae1-associated kinase Bud32 [Ignisphaera sp.]|nr:Kae1-associated kinase Bud32 [Ignisphaera sp.]MCX8168356.1 Kae1-associated kinase Bud32 [Ignisphaera sp.]MDW8085311.1 Kae1-associated kinase Bud32 [Ignisphaera sp.]